ncbi:MAG TPA: Rieske (2Fe-2S) protein [Streptosporangiaceae bacterium]
MSGLLAGHISFRLAGGANHAEEVPHLVKPGWQYLMAAADLADRCSHMSGPLSGGELTDGCLTCPWHGSVFRIADGSVVRGPATAPQAAFEVPEADGAIQVCLPGAG